MGDERQNATGDPGALMPGNIYLSSIKNDDTMPRIDDALSVTGDGVILSIEVSAGSSQENFPAGFNPWRKTILCRVRAPPKDGRANAAVRALIAEVLDLPLTTVQIRSGATSPLKKVFIPGQTKTDLIRQLAHLMQ